MDAFRDLRKAGRNAAATFLHDVVSGRHPTQDVLFRDRRVSAHLCKNCGRAIDIPKRLFFLRDAFFTFRGDVDVPRCVEQGTQDDGYELLTTRALSADPGYDWPARATAEVRRWEKRPDSGFLGPRLRFDGSGFDTNSIYAGRAGWSVVSMGEASRATGSAFGPLPRPVPGAGRGE